MIAFLFFVLGSLTAYFTIDAWAEAERVHLSLKWAMLSGFLFVWLGVFTICL